MNLVQMSLSGAVMILAIIVVRALAINRLPKKVFVLLWDVVLFRLLVPFSISSAWSVYSFVKRVATSHNVLSEIPEDGIYRKFMNVVSTMELKKSTNRLPTSGTMKNALGAAP